MAKGEFYFYNYAYCAAAKPNSQQRDTAVYLTDPFCVLIRIEKVTASMNRTRHALTNMPARFE